jgi:chromosome segregation ATPase
MKTAAEWKGEIQRLMEAKVNDVLKQFETQREKGFGELSELGAQLETLENERNQLLEEKAGLNPLKNADLKSLGLIDMRVTKIEKQKRSLQKRIDGLVAELTEVPENISLLVFIKSKGGVSYDEL